MNYIIKSAIIGDYGVGKTSIISRYASNKYNEGETPLGVDFLHREVDYKENRYKIQIWDTGFGQEKFESIVKRLYKRFKCLYSCI